MLPTVRDVFLAAQLQARDPAPWGQPVHENSPGVYVIATDDDRIVYIGRSRRALRKRLREFYRHRYGASSPHRGGQAVLLLNRPLLVYWATTADYAAAENSMLEYFKAQTGGFPYANRVRSARVGTTFALPQGFLP
jgi:hypothetical protein